MSSAWAILVAGGSGSRLGASLPKQFLPLAGRRVIDHVLDRFLGNKLFQGLVLVVPQDFVEEWKGILPPEVEVTAGGITRQKSVHRGMQRVAADAEWILIHDVARPLVTEELLRKTLVAAQETGAAVTSIPAADTLKRADERFYVQKTVSRERLFQIQTPQVFSRSLLEEAMEWAEDKGMDATDEAGLVESMGHKVRLVEGSQYNFKITRSEDLEMAEALLEKRASNRVVADFRIGEGYDVHAFAEGRDLILGGVKVPFEMGLLGHSDADALLHAIGDALLGAIADGDLGKHFPDTDPKWKGASSRILLAEVARLVQNKGFQVANVDATLICQRPKLAPHISEMRENIAAALSLPVNRVSVKATTEEGLGFTGTMQGLAAKAVVLIQSTGSRP